MPHLSIWSASLSPPGRTSLATLPNSDPLHRHSHSPHSLIILYSVLAVSATNCPPREPPYDSPCWLSAVLYIQYCNVTSWRILLGCHEWSIMHSRHIYQARTHCNMWWLLWYRFSNSNFRPGENRGAVWVRRSSWWSYGKPIITHKQEIRLITASCFVISHDRAFLSP